MKKHFILILLLIFVLSPAFAEQLNLPTVIEQKAISEPLSLPTWSPGGPNNAVFVDSEQGSVSRFIMPFKLNPKQKILTGEEYKKASYEEIVYDIEVKNIYTEILIKIPQWLKYRENSFSLNGSKLSDKDDADRLTYISKKALLKIDLNKKAGAKRIKISFNSKILDKEKAENNTFCYIKFLKDPTDVSKEWQSFP